MEDTIMKSFTPTERLSAAKRTRARLDPDTADKLLQLGREKVLIYFFSVFFFFFGSLFSESKIFIFPFPQNLRKATFT